MLPVQVDELGGNLSNQGRGCGCIVYERAALRRGNFAPKDQLRAGFDAVRLEYGAEAVGLLEYTFG